MMGPGKYDDALTVARQLCGSTGAALIVFEGDKGPGFACQTDLLMLRRLPHVLRHLADEIETDLGKEQI
jgi:hypothetical protein